MHVWTRDTVTRLRFGCGGLVCAAVAVALTACAALHCQTRAHVSQVRGVDGYAVDVRCDGGSRRWLCPVPAVVDARKRPPVLACDGHVLAVLPVDVSQVSR